MERLGDLREFEPSGDEPSVWTPRSAGLLELNLTILSLLAPRSGMPDPQPRRAEVTALLRRLEAGDPEIA